MPFVSRLLLVAGCASAAAGCYTGLDDVDGGQFSTGGLPPGPSGSAGTGPDGSGTGSGSGDPDPMSTGSTAGVDDMTGPGTTTGSQTGPGPQTSSDSGFTTAPPDPETTTGPGVTSDPGTTSGPGITSDPGTTTGPGVTSDPGTTTGFPPDPGTTTGPGVTSDPSTSSDPSGGNTGGDPEVGTYAEGIDLIGIEVNQGSGLILADGGRTVSTGNRDLQVVQGRPAFVRAMYSASSASGTLEGRLTLKHANGSTETIVALHDVQGESDLSERGGTFEWELSGDQVTPGMEYSVGLFVPDAPAAPAPSNPPRIPSSGFDDFGVPDGPMTLELVIIDAGGGLPNVAKEIAEQFFWEMVPINDLQLSYHPETLDTNNADRCLDQVMSLRSSDDPGPQVYYFGISGGGGGGGISGIADDTRWSEDSRASCTEVIGGDWMETMLNFGLHEVGHAMGSEHTSGCGAGGTEDPPNQYVVGGRARIMTYGIGITDGALYDTNMDDIMNYCVPQWVSQFTFEKWRVRASVVSRFRTARDADGGDSYRQDTLRAIVSADGLITWSIARHPVMTAYVPSDRARALVTLSNGGEVDGPVYEVPLSHGASMVLVPLPTRAEGLKNIRVNVLGSTFQFADPLALRADYDRFVRRRAERERR